MLLQAGPIVTNANGYFSNARQQPSSPLAGRGSLRASSRHVARVSDVDYDAVPSPRPRASLASSLRRSSIGLSLLPSNSPPDIGGDVLFVDDDDDDDEIFDRDGDAEEPGSPRWASKRPQTSRHAGPSAVVEDGEGESGPRARSKGKGKETNESREREGVEEEISRGLEDVEMQPEDEAEDPTPKKPKERKPRKKKTLPDVPCKSPLAAERRSS